MMISKKKEPVKDNAATINTTRTIIKANSLQTYTKGKKNKHTRKKSGWNQNDKSRKCWGTGDVKKSVSFRYFLWLGHAFVIISLWQILNFYP